MPTDSPSSSSLRSDWAKTFAMSIIAPQFDIGDEIIFSPLHYICPSRNDRHVIYPVVILDLGCISFVARLGLDRPHLFPNHDWWRYLWLLHSNLRIWFSSILSRECKCTQCDDPRNMPSLLCGILPYLECMRIYRTMTSSSLSIVCRTLDRMSCLLTEYTRSC